MKIYLVKVTSVATNENPHFAGQEAIAYHGIGDRLLGYYGSHPEAVHETLELSQYMIETFGYSRKCDAKRNWSYKNPENSKHWKSFAEIEEIEV